MVMLLYIRHIYLYTIMVDDKEVLLTVRMSAALKAEAAEACRYNGLTLSHYIRSSLTQFVRDYRKQRLLDSSYARQLMDSDLAVYALDSLTRELKASGGSKEFPSDLDPHLSEAELNAGVLDYQLGGKQRPLSSSNVLVNQDGYIDSSKLSRSLRRKFERDLKRGKV